MAIHKTREGYIYKRNLRKKKTKM